MPRLLIRHFAVAAFVFTAFLFAFSSHAEGEANRYLVTGTYIDPGALQPPEAAGKIWETSIGPSLEKLVEWEKEGKIRGGIMVGERRGTFIIDVPSNDNLDQMLQSLPFWPLLQWNIVPLTAFDHRLERDRTVFGAMKEQAK